MEPADVAALRVHTQRLGRDRFAAPEEVVGWLGAVQSQDFEPATWSLGIRSAGATFAGVAAAFDAGRILRTHVLRPTWHFVTPADIRWLLTATAPRVHALNAYMYRQQDLAPALLDHCCEVLVEALRGGRHLTRPELGSVLADHGVEAAGIRLGYIAMYAELEAVICSGARRGNQQTYALLSERAPDATVLDEDEALGELAGRYFTGHGPATAKDLAAWASLGVKTVERGIEMVADELQRVDAGAVTYWAGADDGPQPAPDAASLLQIYDEYAMGYRETRGVIDVAGVAVSRPAEERSFTGLVVLGTQLVARWRRTLARDRVTVQVQPLRTLSRPEQREIGRAAEAYAAFQERTTVDLQMGG